MDESDESSLDAGNRQALIREARGPRRARSNHHSENVTITVFVLISGNDDGADTGDERGQS